MLCSTTSLKVASLVGRHCRPDVILLEAVLIDNDSGQSVGPLIHQLGEIPILLLDEDVNNGRLAAVLDAPIAGYFTRGVPFSDLVEGIRRLVQGERVFDPTVKNRICQTPHGWQFRHVENSSLLSALTPREIEVLKLIALGHSVRDCADRLDLALSTVDNHKARPVKKLHVHKALDLTRLAIREGLVRI